MARKKNNVDLNDLSSWPLPLVLFVSLLVVCGVAFVIKMFVADPVTDTINSTESEIKSKELEYAKNQEVVALLSHIRTEVNELEIIRDEAKKYLPTEISMPSLIDNVYLAARGNGIVFNDFTPKPDIDTEFYIIKPVELSADVGYLSMSSFIEQVTSLKRIMNVESVFFKAEAKNGSPLRDSDDPLTMTAQLRTYVFKDTKNSKTKQ